MQKRFLLPCHVNVMFLCCLLSGKLYKVILLRRLRHAEVSCKYALQYLSFEAMIWVGILHELDVKPLICTEEMLFVRYIKLCWEMIFETIDHISKYYGYSFECLYPAINSKGAFTDTFYSTRRQAHYMCNISHSYLFVSPSLWWKFSK